MAQPIVAPESKPKRAFTLYFIVVVKLLKAALLVAAALTAYALSDNALLDELRKLLAWLHLDAGSQFFRDVAARLAKITEHDALWFAAMTLLYSLFSWVEGIGLLLRVRWCGYLAMGESAFFIPLEINGLLKHFSWGLFCLLLLNGLIVWYLFTYRERLFKHH